MHSIVYSFKSSLFGVIFQSSQAANAISTNQFGDERGGAARTRHTAKQQAIIKIKLKLRVSARTCWRCGARRIRDSRLHSSTAPPNARTTHPQQHIIQDDTNSYFACQATHLRREEREATANLRRTHNSSTPAAVAGMSRESDVQSLVVSHTIDRIQILITSTSCSPHAQEMMGLERQAARTLLESCGWDLHVRSCACIHANLLIQQHCVELLSSDPTGSFADEAPVVPPVRAQ